MTISADAVTRLLKSVPGIAALNVIDAQLVENITGHLKRDASLPGLGTGASPEQYA